MYVGGFELPDKNAAAQRVIGNAKLFNALDYNVYFIGTDKSLDSKVNLIGTKSIFEGFVHYNIPYPTGLKEWYFYLCNISYKYLIKEINPQLIIAYNYPAIALNKLRKYCGQNDIRLIADCTEWYLLSGSIIFRIIKGFDTFYRMRIIHNKLDGVIAISNYLSNYYKNRGCKTVVIPPIVNIDDFKKLYNNNNHDDIINLIYVGQPFPVDGRMIKESSYKDRLDKVIDVLYYLRDMQFIFNIYGLTKEQYLSVIPGQKDLLDVLGNKIKFYGYIENHEALKKIAESDFTVLFRDVNRMTTAGFPTKFVETISCGTPIITNRTSDLEQYLQDGKNGYFVEIEDKAKLLAKMKEILMLDRKSISLMKKNCQESELFSYHKFKNKMCQFLNSINIT